MGPRVEGSGAGTVVGCTLQFDRKHQVLLTRESSYPPCVTILLSLHLTCGRYSHSANTVRHSGRFCTLDARFGIATLVWNASTADYPLLHRHCVFGGGHGRFRQVAASRHCGRRPEGIVGKYVQATGPVFTRNGTNAIAITQIKELKSVHVDTDAR